MSSIAFCAKCGKQTEFTIKNGNMICKECWINEN